jgi:hypothetical protein
MIAERGVWCNPLYPDKKLRKEKDDKICRGLVLADRVGARCCVSVAGSRGGLWFGWHPQDLSEETFRWEADIIQVIVDTVRPSHTRYAGKCGLQSINHIEPDRVLSLKFQKPVRVFPVLSGEAGFSGLIFL